MSPGGRRRGRPGRAAVRSRRTSGRSRSPPAGVDAALPTIGLCMRVSPVNAIVSAGSARGCRGARPAPPRRRVGECRRLGDRGIRRRFRPPAGPNRHRADPDRCRPSPAEGGAAGVGSAITQPTATASTNAAPRHSLAPAPSARSIPPQLSADRRCPRAARSGGSAGVELARGGDRLELCAVPAASVPWRSTIRFTAAEV